MLSYKLLRGDPRQPLVERFRHLCALGVIWLFFCALLGCKPGASKVPTAEYVAGLTVNTVALGVKIADEQCANRAVAMYKAGDKDGAVELATKCAGLYEVARNSLLAAAYAVDGWADAAQRGKVVCALSEAATAIRLVVDAIKKAGAFTPPREITMALAAVAVLADMVEAKSCPLPAPAPAPAASGGTSL